MTSSPPSPLGPIARAVGLSHTYTPARPMGYGAYGMRELRPGPGEDAGALRVFRQSRR
ncbi:MAG: hypothetical protein ACLPKB_30535 [Xanthobacteraceae bacterium]